MHFQVTIPYPSGTKTYNITPTRERPVKQIVKKQYSSAIGSLQKLVKPHELVAIPVRKITEEIKSLCHLDQDSVLRDSDEALHTFSWDVVWCELESKVPTLLQLYKQLFPGASKVLICFAISLVMKWRSPKMSLIQRVVSTFLYGNGAAKQVGMYNTMHACVLS